MPVAPGTTTYASGWSKINVNNFTDVAYTKAAHDALVAATGSPSFWGAEGPKSVIDAWGGAAFDPSTGRMYFSGGGHNAYGGNEVYAFDFNTGLWSRISDPAPYTGPELSPGDAYPYPNTAFGPLSNHTYDSITWSDATQSFWMTQPSESFDIGYNGDYPANKGVWEFKPSTGTWTKHTGSDGEVYSASTYIPSTGEVWFTGRDGGATIVSSTGVVSDVALTGDRTDLYNLGAMAYDDTTGKVFFVRNAYGSIVSTLTRTANGLQSTKVADLPVAVTEAIGGGMGLAMRDGKLWLWGGTDKLASYDPVLDEWYIYDLPTGPAGQRVYGKFYYWADRDVFVGVGSSGDGVWAFNPDQLTGTKVDLNAKRASVNGVQFATIQGAIDAAQDGDTITILPGTYGEAIVVNKNNLTINATGVHLKDGIYGDKGAVVVTGNNTTIVGLEASGQNASDGNGAAVRLEGNNLTLRNVYFHDSQEGLLSGNSTGGTIVVENSIFENLGGAAGIALGRAHGIYVGRGADALIIRDTQFLGGKEEGHLVKSRAARTEIYNSVLDGLNGDNSRVIDIPEAGVLILDGVTVRQGPNATNPEIIGYALETHINPWHTQQEITIRNSTIVNDYGTSGTFLRIGTQPNPAVATPVVTLENNTFVNVTGTPTYR